jgi:hypothetical protein
MVRKYNEYIHVYANESSYQIYFTISGLILTPELNFFQDWTCFCHVCLS